MNQFGKALSYYIKAVEISPESSNSYLFRGHLYHQQLNQPHKALGDFSKAVQLNNFEAYDIRGDVYMQLKQYKAALADYNKAIEFRPNSLRTHKKRGNAYFHLQNYDLALADFATAMEVHPLATGIVERMSPSMLAAEKGIRDGTLKLVRRIPGRYLQ